MDSITVHASCVRMGRAAVLILGASGSGKSSLALALMGMGAELVADDRTSLRRQGNRLIADAPDSIRGRIEARGIGILSAPAAGPTPLCLIVDLDRIEAERLPPRREMALSGVTLPVVPGPLRPGLAPALRQLMLAGRVD